MTVPRLAPLLILLARASLAGEPGLSHIEQVDAHVYRGCQPGNQGFASLSRLGIKTVIDMRGGSVHMPHEIRLVKAAGLSYVEERFSGIFAPHDQQIAKLLAVMEDPSAAPVFVHCRRGADRVGMLIACYRIAHDHWSNEDAFAEACRYGLSPFEPFMRAYIRHFDPARLKMAPAPASILPALFDFLPGH